MRLPLFVAVLLLSWKAGAEPALAVPRFEPGACAVEVVATERIDCGLLVVPENRHKADSRPIRLPVTIFRSRAAKPLADPVLFMPGGPGLSAVEHMTSGKNNTLLDERDYIVLEQRGAKFAQPSLQCPETTRLKSEVAAGRLRGPAAITALTQAAGRCRTTLTASGVDLDGYTSEATADDIEDLRKVLGVARWNLYGVSYSTRLMLTVLRRHPEGVRSVVLDSVLPPEVNFDEVSATNVLRVLNQVFDGCAVDRACGARYPDLRARFAKLVADADRRPLKLALRAAGAPAEIRGAQVVEAIYSAMHEPIQIPRIPRLIVDASEGRLEALRGLISDNQAPSAMAWGLRYSVWCAEELPFEDAERIAAQQSPAMGLGGVSAGNASPQECRAWNVTAAPAVENEPVKSDVPALVFAGEFDPDTPPEWGHRLLDSMPNAYPVDMRGRSHAASFNSCGASIVKAFLQDPSHPPAVDCALKRRGADFSLSVRP
ncbi:alpha/beta fold hydrolase [Corallococcus macrosporus]|uniref:Proline iminopeptidase n=1 Tax=Corallococcus macrosporus TaxID=35 RepID=A0ABS3DCP1_9BACT|nr:alpha/beta fold hydrolase [Corallococcus macrosporus]MBN8228810.1 alpha/beta fold hydrolase [Corallococcus macrosporus]